MSEEKPKTIKVDIRCPNCEMRKQHEYTQDTYSPVYAQCSFCGTLYLWKKHKTVEVIPQSSKQYIINL